MKYMEHCADRLNASIELPAMLESAGTDVHGRRRYYVVLWAQMIEASFPQIEQAWYLK